MIDLFRSYGHVDIDTARVYGDGSSESFLGQLNLTGVNLDTKLFPSAANPAIAAMGTPYHHNAQDLRLGLMRSLEALQVPKVHVWYLHSPDRTVPFEDTLREVNDLHQEGYFENLGISNYQSWELAKLCEISERNGWIKPSVCQGIYNAFHRAVEPELLRCLRHYGISFYCFNPLAASLLTSRYSRDKPEATAGGRFDPGTRPGALSRRRYYQDVYFDALEIFTPPDQQQYSKRFLSSAPGLPSTCPPWPTYAESSQCQAAGVTSFSLALSQSLQLDHVQDPLDCLHGVPRLVSGKAIKKAHSSIERRSLVILGHSSGWEGFIHKMGNTEGGLPTYLQQQTWT